MQNFQKELFFAFTSKHNRTPFSNGAQTVDFLTNFYNFSTLQTTLSYIIQSNLFCYVSIIKIK